MPAEDRTVSIAADHLQPVQPSRGDRVKVIMGETLTYIYFLTCSSRFRHPNYLFQILNIPHASTNLFWVYDPRNRAILLEDFTEFFKRTSEKEVANTFQCASKEGVPKCDKSCKPGSY